MMRRLCLPVVLALLSAPLHAAEPEKYLPNATQAIVTIHVKPFLESALFKDNLDGVKQAWKQLGFDQTMTDCLGLNPFADIERVQLALLPNMDNEPPLLLLHGTFDPAKVQAALQKCVKDGKSHVEKYEHNGRSFHRLRLDPSDAEKPLYAAPLSDGVVALSTSPDRIVEAIDKKDGKRKTELRKDVQNLLSRIDARHAVSVASLSGPLNFAGLLGNAPGNLQNLAGGIVLGEDMKLELAMTARDIQSAKSAAGQLTDQLNQLKAAVAVLVTQQKQFTPLADLVNGARISAQSNEVTFKLTVPKELIDSVFKKSE